MTGWTPLYQQIVGSSIWEAPDHVRLAWITLLAVSNKDGVAAVTTSGLARLANISQENAKNALDVLSAPDADTLTQENDGRRIERCQNGWKLLNFMKYRDMARKQALREYNSAAQARSRASKGRQILKSDAEEPESEDQDTTHKGELPIRLMRDGLSQLYGRDVVAPWGYEEERSLVAVCKRWGCEDELLELKNYKRRNGQFFPKSVESLLTGWTKTLDQARSSEKDAADTPQKNLVDKELDRLEREADKS